MTKSSSLAPGFRFCPTDVELVRYFLKRKVLGKSFPFEAISVVDIYKFAPWDLPDKSLLRTGDLKWYFFCPREKKYPGGARTNRSTHSGYWKTTGKDRSVHYNNAVTGMIKSLVFHTGKPPKGDRTDWVMYEYRLEDKELADQGIVQDTYVVCAVFKKDGLGPKNGAQYGAPFKEEDWDTDDEVNPVEASPYPIVPEPEAMLPFNQNGSVITSLNIPSNRCNGISDSGPSQAMPTAACTPISVVSNNEAASGLAVLLADDGENHHQPRDIETGIASADSAPLLEGNVDIEGLIDCFTDPCFSDPNVNAVLWDPFEDGLELSECANNGGNFENGPSSHNDLLQMKSCEWPGEVGVLNSNQDGHHMLPCGVGQLPHFHSAVSTYSTDAYRHKCVPVWLEDGYQVNPHQSNIAAADIYQADPHQNNAQQLHYSGYHTPLGEPTQLENKACIVGEADQTLTDHVASTSSYDWNAASSSRPEVGTTYSWNATFSSRPNAGAGHGPLDLQ